MLMTSQRILVHPPLTLFSKFLSFLLATLAVQQTHTVMYWFYMYLLQGVTQRCRLPWLTNSALVCEPRNAGGWGLRGLS